jgi:ABC-type hemin transport system ATPase subunit
MNVEITDVTRRFGRAEAVAEVSLETGPGVFGLLGPNGAGKTTLLGRWPRWSRRPRAGCGCSAGTPAAWWLPVTDGAWCPGLFAPGLVLPG